MLRISSYVGFGVIKAMVIKSNYLLGCTVIQSVESRPTFQRLHIQDRRITREQYTSMKSGSKLTLKMYAICSSETSTEFQRTTRCDVPEDRNLFRFIYVRHYE
jgi:hypothetical protein